MKTRWLFSTIGKRGYIADYLREADPDAYVVGSGVTKFTPGFTSCDEAVLMPDIRSTDYPEAVRRLVASHRIDAILSFTDPDVAALSSLRPELARQGVSCFFPERPLAMMGFDKLATAQWAIENDVATPRTLSDPAEALRQIGLPLIRKPRFGSASVGIAVIRDARDLLPARQDQTEYLYQELIEGDEVNVEICGDLDGRPMGLSAWKKILSRNGETELAVTTRRPELLEAGRCLAEKAKLVGPCDVDLIERAGTFHLIEFNMRFGGGYPVSHLAGADFLRLLVRAQRGERPAYEEGFADDIFMMKTLRPFGGPLTESDALFSAISSYRRDPSD